MQAVTKEQIEEMKKMVIFTKKLSDWHAKNLQRFPLIAFDNVKKAEIQYELGLEGKPAYMYFYLTRKGKGKFSKNQVETVKRGEHFRNWVHSILWKEIDVRVYNKTDGKQIFPIAKEA